MTPTDFSISLGEWETAEYGPPEERETVTKLAITVGGITATESIDTWSRTVKPSVRVSAYPLALWLATSWWRVRWEPAPIGKNRSHDWRMAHEVAAVGGGYVWPLMYFESDGDCVEVRCRPTRKSDVESIQYLSRVVKYVSGDAFERTVDEFILSVLARLDAIGLKNTELHVVWKEVMDERRSSKATLRRKLEAYLGFDSEEAPEGQLAELIAFQKTAGAAAAAEIAAACAGPASSEMLSKVQELAQSEGVSGAMNIPALNDVSPLSLQSVYPWERGWCYASNLRSACGLNGNKVTDETLFSLLSLPANTRGVVSATTRPSMGLAVRNRDSSSIRFMLRKNNHAGLRFEAARIVGDLLYAEAKDRWYPVTDCKTARQKFQRAFAAAFLCPIDSLQNFLDNDYSERSMEKAAKHYNVSPLAIQSHLVNNNIINLDAAPMLHFMTLP